MDEEDVQATLDMNDDDNVLGDIGDEADDQEITLPSKTYKVENGRILSYIDGLDAMVQAVQKLLSTDRLSLDIYSANYGSDLMDIIGKNRDFAVVEIERIMTDALQADDRIIGVKIDDVYIDEDNNLMVFASVNTIFGTVDVEQEVD